MIRVASAALIALGAVAAAAEPASPSFGAMRFGDDMATVRAAFPGTAWRDAGVSKITGRVTSMEAAGAVEIGGQRFDANVAPGYYGGYTLTLTRGFVSNAGSCERDFSTLIETLEAQLGPVNAEPALLDRQRITDDRKTDGGTSFNTWPLGQRMEVIEKAGKRSRYVTGDSNGGWAVKRLLDGSQPEVRLMRSRGQIAGSGAKPIIVSIAGDFWDLHAVKCTLSIQLQRDADVPAPETMTFDTKYLRLAGSVVRRHRSLESLPAVPETGLHYRFECAVPRTGSEWSGFKCRGVDADESSPFYPVAKRWAESARFDFAGSGLDRDDPRLLLITIPIDVLPGDRRSLDFLGAPAVEADAIPFARSPRTSADAYFPPRAKRLGLQGVAVLACQVQADQSILCGPRADAEQPDPDFISAGIKLAEGFEAAPAFPDGRSTAGQVFVRRVVFKLRND
jgi:hypothetical protein